MVYGVWAPTEPLSVAKPINLVSADSRSLIITLRVNYCAGVRIFFGRRVADLDRQGEGLTSLSVAQSIKLASADSRSLIVTLPVNYCAGVRISFGRRVAHLDRQGEGLTCLIHCAIEFKVSTFHARTLQLCYRKENWQSIVSDTIFNAKLNLSHTFEFENCNYMLHVCWRMNTKELLVLGRSAWLPLEELLVLNPLFYVVLSM